MKALRSLYFCQLGHYPKQGNRYFAGLESVIDSLSERYDLPLSNNIEMHISDDGQSWYAARPTITGHWFAIGAAGPPTDQWFLRRPHRAELLSQRIGMGSMGAGQQLTQLGGDTQREASRHHREARDRAPKHLG